MNFHSTTNSRIREISSVVSMEHTVTLHYCDTSCAVRIDNVVVVDKNVEAI